MKRPFSPGILSALILAAPAAFSANPLHQWKFNDGADSIGSSPATLVGSASFTGGSLQLPGTGTFANYAQVDISNSLNTNQSLTIESWFTLSQLNVWSKVWMFGNNSGEPTRSYINFTPRTGIAGNVPKTDFNSSLSPTSPEFNTTGGANPAALAITVGIHALWNGVCG